MTNTVLDPRIGDPIRRAPRPYRPVRQRALVRLLSLPSVAVPVAVLGTAMLALVGLAAPNDHTLDARLPLSVLPTLPGAASTFITVGAIALQLVGLLGMLAANAEGWRPRPGRLFAVGAATAALFACLTPIGSADVASYAAYGRIAALGGDPYVDTPDRLGGAYEHLVSSSWIHTPSVYGPVATWIQQAAAEIGGSRPWLTIWLLMLANAAVYLAVGGLLLRTAKDKTRACLLWTANPLLLGQMVGGGHLDTYVAGAGLLAVLFAKRGGRAGRAWDAGHGMLIRDDLLSGVFLGLACGVKVSAALLGLGLVWPLLRQDAWARALRIAGAGLATLAALYSAYGLHAFAPLSSASGQVSVPSFWQMVQWAGRSTIGASATSTLISVSWPVLLLVIAFLLQRRIPRTAPADAALPFALVFAWIIVAPWCMPWYAAIAWPLAAVLPRSRTTKWLALLSAVLAMVHNTGGHGWVW